MVTAMVDVRAPEARDTVDALLRNSGMKPKDLEDLLSPQGSAPSSLQTAKGEELLYKVLPNAAVADYIQSGAYGRSQHHGTTNPYELNSDLSGELLHLKPGTTTLLVLPNSRELAKYALRQNGAAFTLGHEKDIPFGNKIVSHLFLFDPAESAQVAMAVHYAKHENPSQAPLNVMFGNRGDYPGLVGLDAAYLATVRKTDGETAARLEHFKGISTAERLVRDYLSPRN